MEEKLIFLRVSELDIDMLAERLSELHFVYARQNREPAFWRWRYLNSPFGKSILIVALRGSRIVGMYGLLNLSLTVQGKRVIGGLLGDFCIHPSERSWRCFSGLVETLIVESRKDKAAFHFGVVPSELKKLSQRLGAKSIGRIPIYLGFLNIFKVLEGRSVPYPLSLAGWFIQPVIGLKKKRIGCNDLDIRPIESFNGAFDELWNSVVENRNIAVNKNAAYLNWRYGECPEMRFKCLAAYRKERLEGLVIFCVTGLRKSGFILELLARDDNLDIMRALLLQAAQELKMQGIGHTTASFFTIL